MSPATIALVYIVTAVIGISAALLLFHMARLSGQAKMKISRKAKRDYADIDDSLKQTIFEEINEYVDSHQQGQKISKAISGVLSKELKSKVEEVKEQIGKKYEDLIDQKSKTEEIAWKKYNKVLSDKKRTEAVIHSIAEGLVVVDSSGKVVMMNPAAEKLLDVTKKEKVGKSILDDLKDEELVSLASDKASEGREIELSSQQDETKKTLRASSAIIEDENGQTVGMVSVLSDITKQKELDRMKSNFVASVSHELRTPIVAVEKSLSLILSKSAGAINETQEQFLSIAERNLKRLNLLINDLLDLSKLEAGKMEFKPETSSIEEVIDESIQTLNNWAGTKSISIKKDIAEDIPGSDFDPNRMIQVLNNLIGNAIKYTPNNGVITVAARVNATRSELEVSVQDTGLGIDKENLPKIFDKFYQIGERSPSDISGTGIGLSIVKEIVERHHGRVWVESEKGKGTRFIFTLPLR